MSQDFSSIGSVKLLVRKLHALLGVLEATGKSEFGLQDFSSVSLDVIRFLGVVSDELSELEEKDVSNFGMAMLMLELGYPEKSLIWWRRDLLQAKEAKAEFDKEARNFLDTKYQEIQERWLSSKDQEWE